jgi:hypothetical protein
MRRTLCIASIATLWVSLSLPLAGSRDADARVVMMPSIPRSCPGSSTWQATLACIERFGTAKILRSQGAVRLVQLRARENDFRTSGLYLYVQEKKRWHIGGTIFDPKPKVIGFSTPSYDHRKLFRIDLVYAANEEILVDEVTSRNAFVRRKTSMFCSGESSSCSDIVTACDVFVGGRLLATFRGALAYEGGGVMSVTGDRSRAGEQCTQPEQTFIPVPVNLESDTLE